MTSKTIAVLEAGTGLGASVAERFGLEGYRVALVARRREPLTALRAELRAAGVEAEAFPADLSDPTGAPGLITTIRDHFGRIDVLHYAPAPSRGFTPAAELGADTLRDLLALFLLTPVELVRAALPEMLERGDGAILVGQGTSASQGHPGMSGIGPAMAAMRNYVQSLHAEVADRGVYAGMLTVAAMVDRSAAYRRLLSGEFTLPNGLKLPEGPKPPEGLKLPEGARQGGARPEGTAEATPAAGGTTTAASVGAVGAAGAAGATGAGAAGAGAGPGAEVGASAGTGAGTGATGVRAGTGVGAGASAEAGAGTGATGAGTGAGTRVRAEGGAGARLGVVDPDDLAEVCWALVTERDRVEVVWPVPLGA
ncbi:SDR family NAD(P)-dependent oxidoreductase [Actinosynnema sp. NPDC059797]